MNCNTVSFKWIRKLYLYFQSHQLVVYKQLPGCRRPAITVPRLPPGGVWGEEKV